MSGGLVKIPFLNDIRHLVITLEIFKIMKIRYNCCFGLLKVKAQRKERLGTDFVAQGVLAVFLIQ